MGRRHQPRAASRCCKSRARLAALQFGKPGQPASISHDTTAAEIWEQMEGPRRRLRKMALARAELLSGVGALLKEKNPAVITVRRD